MFFVCNIRLKSEKDKNRKKIISKRVGEFRNRRKKIMLVLMNGMSEICQYVGEINDMSEGWKNYIWDIGPGLSG